METNNNKEIRKAEYAMREKVVAAIRAGIETAAIMNHTDPKANLKACRDQFKETLKQMELPFNLLVVRAMIEGATYIRTAQKMGNLTFNPEMSLGLLMLFEDELIKEKEAKLKDAGMENL